jgi:hypothetical protein
MVRTESLYTSYPAFGGETLASAVLPPSEFRQYEKVSNRCDESYFAARALDTAVDRIISRRSPWKWGDNSCHLDCYLMVELAFFGSLVHNSQGSQNLLTDDVVLKCPALSKLFAVLLSAGTKTQDALKMAYWAYEIEEYFGGSSTARSTFGKCAGYDQHGDYMASALLERNNVDLRATYVGFQPVCNNPEKHAIDPIQKKSVTVTAIDNWYTLPDDWTRQKGTDGRWRSSCCHFTKHAGLGDVMGSLLGRTDGETTDCPKCAAESQKCYQITWMKEPEKAKLPLALEFAVDPNQLVQAEAQINVGGLQYTLLAVVFGDGNHFTCNVLLHEYWFHYDGLGFHCRVDPDQTAKGAAGKYPAIPRMVRAQDHMTPPPPGDGFSPVVYRYIRCDATHLGPVSAPDPSKIPTHFQFNNMWRLMN